MAELKGQQVQFIGSKSYANAIQESNGNIHFTTDTNGSIVVNGKVYGTVNSNLMSTPTSGSLKEYIDNKVTNGIGALDVDDAAVLGKYVSAVSESNGKITVTRADLPVLSGGATGTNIKPIKSVTVNGHTITVTTVDANLATEANLNNHINDKVKHITAEERTLWTDAASYINAFLADSAAGDAAIDTLKEIQQFLNDDTTGTAALAAKVNKSVKDVVNSFGSWTNSQVDQDITAPFSLTLTLNDGTTTTYDSSINIPFATDSNAGVVSVGLGLKRENDSSDLTIDTDGITYINNSGQLTVAHATTDKYGVVKIGTGLSISSGVVSLNTNTKMANATHADSATDADYAYNAGTAGTATWAANIAGGAKGTIFYNTEANTTETLAIGTAGQVLKVVNGVPAWQNDLNDKVKVTRSEDATYLIGISSEGNGGVYTALNNSYTYTKSGTLYTNSLHVSDQLTVDNNITMNGGKAVATEEYVNDKIDEVNGSTSSVSSYVEALSSEVATLSYDVETIKAYLLWQ